MSASVGGDLDSLLAEDIELINWEDADVDDICEQVLAMKRREEEEIMKAPGAAFVVASFTNTVFCSRQRRPAHRRVCRVAAVDE